MRDVLVVEVNAGGGGGVELLTVCISGLAVKPITDPVAPDGINLTDN